jgi:hypothetical protein
LRAATLPSPTSSENPEDLAAGERRGEIAAPTRGKMKMTTVERNNTAVVDASERNSELTNAPHRGGGWN